MPLEVGICRHWYPSTPMAGQLEIFICFIKQCNVEEGVVGVVPAAIASHSDC